MSRISVMLGAGMLAVPASVASADETPAAQAVPYGDVQVTVPPDWRVVSFEETPHACLRLDKPALYLGHTGDQAECTASAVARDRGDTLHLEPADGAPERADIPTVTVQPGQRLPDGLPESPSGELRFVLEQQGLVATVGYGTSPDRVVEIVRGVLAQAEDGAGEWRTRRPTRPPAKEPVVPGAFKGRAFDACTAPSPSQMRAWRASSPYAGVGIYIGGPARACAQNALTPGWVSDQAAAGWHLMPIWVGPQPWTGNSNSLSTSLSGAATQGRTAAEGAVTAARALGLGEGTVLYNDLENYSDRARWDKPVLSYLDAWTRRVQEHGYRSGVYVAKSSGVQALSAQYTTGAYTMPDVLWTANWNGSADVGDSSMGLPAGRGQWPGSRRAHQYKGNVSESYGGVRISVDRNQLDVGDAADAPDPVFSVNTTNIMAAADFTGDGRADMAAVHRDGSLHAYHADQNGKLTYGGRLWPDRTWGAVRQLVGGDFTGSGAAQLAAVWGDGSLHRYEADEDGTLRHAGRMWQDTTWRSVRKLSVWKAADGGRDGLVAVWNDGSLRRYQARADGTLEAGSARIWKDKTWRSVRHLTSGRFTESGGTDLVAVWADGSLRRYPGDDAGTVGASRPMWRDRTWGTMRAVVAADFTGGGDTDLMGYWNSRRLHLYAGPGDGTLKPGVAAAR